MTDAADARGMQRGGSWTEWQRPAAKVRGSPPPPPRVSEAEERPPPPHPPGEGEALPAQGDDVERPSSSAQRGSRLRVSEGIPRRDSLPVQPRSRRARREDSSEEEAEAVADHEKLIDLVLERRAPAGASEWGSIEGGSPLRFLYVPPGVLHLERTALAAAGARS